MSETNERAAEVITALDPVARQAVEWALEGYTGPRRADTIEAVAEVVRQWRVSQDLARQAREENEKVFKRYAFLKADTDRMMNERAKPVTIPSDKPAEPMPEVAPKERTYAEVCAAESQLQAMVRAGPVVVDAGDEASPVVRLAIPIRELIDAFAGAKALCGGPIKYPSEMAGVVVRLARAQAEKQPDAEKRVEALENQHLDHRLTALHEAHQALRDDVRHMREDVGALWNSVMPTKLVERVQALEGGPKAKARAGQEARYRVVTESGGKAMIKGWLRDLKMMDRPAWLERSDDNGRTWKRCDVRGEAIS